jgi:hypothetical protein
LGANVFTGDPNCVALWRFESGALGTDSIGSNSVAGSGGASADTGNKKEGGASVDLVAASSQYLFLDDGSLDSGYPLKNGSSSPKHSYCGWFYMDLDPSSGQARIVYSKYHTVNARSILVYLYNDGTGVKFAVNIGYNSGISEEGAEIPRATHDVQTGQWYHFAFTHNDSTKAWHIRLWDDSGSTAYDNTGTFTNNITINNQPINIGREPSAYWQYWDGHVDELVVFNDILTTNEIDQIRSGTFPGGGAAQIMPVTFSID